MTLKTYIKKLSKIAEKHPEIEIIFTEDEGFNYIKYTDYVLKPKLGYFDGEDFLFKEDFYVKEKRPKVNAVLLS